MVPPALAERVSAADYLRWEAEQPDKHEYVDGEVFAMGVDVGRERLFRNVD